MRQLKTMPRRIYDENFACVGLTSVYYEVGNNNDKDEDNTNQMPFVDDRLENANQGLSTSTSSLFC